MEAEVEAGAGVENLACSVQNLQRHRDTVQREIWTEVGVLDGGVVVVLEREHGRVCFHSWKSRNRTKPNIDFFVIKHKLFGYGINL